MSATSIVHVEPQTVTLHGTGASATERVTLRHESLGAVGLNAAWHLETVALAILLGMGSMVPLVVARLAQQWLVQAVLVSSALVGSAVLVFVCARRHELVVHSRGDRPVFRARYAPWHRRRALDALTCLEDLLGRTQDPVPHPIDATLSRLVDPGALPAGRGHIRRVDAGAPRRDDWLTLQEADVSAPVAPSGRTSNPQPSWAGTVGAPATWTPTPDAGSHGESPASRPPVCDARGADPAPAEMPVETRGGAPDVGTPAPTPTPPPASRLHPNPWFEHLMANRRDDDR